MPRGVPVACVAIDNAANAVRARELRHLFSFYVSLFVARTSLRGLLFATIQATGQLSRFFSPADSTTPLRLSRVFASSFLPPKTSLPPLCYQALLAIRMLGAAAASSDAASSRLLDRMAAYQREQRDEVECKALRIEAGGAQAYLEEMRAAAMAKASTARQTYAYFGNKMP